MTKVLYMDRTKEAHRKAHSLCDEVDILLIDSTKVAKRLMDHYSVMVVDPKHIQETEMQDYQKMLEGRSIPAILFTEKPENYGLEPDIHYDAFMSKKEPLYRLQDSIDKVIEENRIDFAPVQPADEKEGYGISFFD